MRKTIIIYLLIIFNVIQYQNAAAQKQGQARIDSLLYVLKADPDFSKGTIHQPDTNSINLLIDLAYEYHKIDPDEGIKYGEQASELSKRIAWKKGIASAGNRLGLCYWAKADFPKSLEYHFAALKLSEEIDDKEIVTIILGNIGLVYSVQQLYSKALEYHFEAMKMNEDLGDKRGVARNMGNIGIVYDAQGDYIKSLEYYFKALTMYEELADRGGVARNLGNIGFVYQEQRNHLKALEYYYRALKMNDSLGNKILMAQNLGNIGEEYYNIAVDTGKTKLSSLPDSLQKHEALIKAEKFLKESINLFEAINDLNSLQELYMYLSDLKALTGNYKESMIAYKKHIASRDSVFSEANKREIKLLEKNREEDLKQKEIELLKKENEIQRLTAQRRKGVNYGLGTAFILLGAVTFSFFNQNKKRKRINSELKKAYSELKNTQKQLVKSEKMAAFGMMASRVAHEIQNPLNFVNNFSELNADLVNDVISSASEKDKMEATAALIENSKKIIHHGKRADSIVKELLDRTRSGTAHEFFEEDKGS